jgi:hypothetical protein
MTFARSWSELLPLKAAKVEIHDRRPVKSQRLRQREFSDDGNTERTPCFSKGA